MANMNKQGYSINWQTNTITMTKKFAEEANQYGSDAYNLLMDVKSKGFHINVRQSKPRKACPTRVTFKQMEITLSCMDHPDERMAELNAEWRGQPRPTDVLSLECERPEDAVGLCELGDIVLRRLLALDKVAYIRFASVYKDFKDIDEFTAELRSLGA